jgi:hypothetical protein
MVAEARPVIDPCAFVKKTRNASVHRTRAVHAVFAQRAPQALGHLFLCISNLRHSREQRNRAAMGHFPCGNAFPNAAVFAEPTFHT